MVVLGGGVVAYEQGTPVGFKVWVREYRKEFACLGVNNLRHAKQSEGETSLLETYLSEITISS